MPCVFPIPYRFLANLCFQISLLVLQGMKFVVSVFWLLEVLSLLLFSLVLLSGFMFCLV